MGLFDDLLEEDELTQQPVQPQSQRRKGGLFDDLLEEEDLIQDTRPQVGQPAATEEEEFSYFKPIIEQEEIKPKPEEQGILRQVADIPLGIARGGVTGIKMMTDILGADNPVSKSLSGVEGYMADLMSAQAKEDQQEISRIMKDAEDKGFGEQVKAGIKAFSIAPVDIMSQALGTMAPVIATGLAGSAAKLGALGMRAVQAGVGAGMGAGMIKGEIYNEVKNELVNSGIAEDAAEKAAVEAQSYGGKNLDQILLGAGLGAASTLGAEGIITRILTKQGTAPAAGVVSRVLKGGLTEAAPEAAQAAQEQLAKNVALQREGFDVDPSRGVVAAATMEAVAAAPLGGIAGAVERPAPIKTLAEENLEQTNEIARKVAENGAPLTASAIQDQAATNLRQDELAKQLEAQLEEELVAVKEPTAAAQKPMSKDEFKAIYSQVAPEELDAAEVGFTNTLATATTEEARANAQNALEAIKEVKATVTPPAPPVAPTITPAVTPAVPAAQPPITDATQEIIQPEGVRPELETGVEVPTPQAGVSRGVFDTTRGQEEGQVVPPAPAIPEAITRAIEERKPISAPFALQYGIDLPRGWTYEDDFFVPPAEPAPAAEVPAVTPTPAAEVAAPEPIISEIPPTSELVGAEPTQPTIREVPEISPIVGAEPAAIVEQEPVAPAEPAVTPVSAEPVVTRTPEGLLKTTQIGRTWQTSLGQATIQSEATVGGQPRFLVKYERGATELVRPEELEDRIALDVKMYESRQKMRTESQAQREAEQIQKTKYQDFTQSMTPMQASKAFNALETNVQSGGQIIKRGDLVKQAVDEGSEIVIARDGKRRLQKPDGSYRTESQISKTAMDYADYLIQKKSRQAEQKADDRETDFVIMPTTPAAPAPVTTPPVTEAVTPAAEAPAPEAAPTPAGISVGNRIKLGKSPQTYTIEEVIPQSATERELGEQYYSVKNERTGETQVVEARDLKQVKGKGARKLFAGERAEIPQFMRDSLDSARAMAAAGKTTEEIRAVTGWFPGRYDGKMRWEIPDNKARFIEREFKTPAPKIIKGTFGKNLNFTQNDDGLYYAEINGKPDWATGAETREGAENLYYEFNPRKIKYGFGVSGKLFDVIDHGNLFKAYPSAREIAIQFALLPPEKLGAYVRGENKIVISSSLNKNEALSTILHEIQHWVQEQEGFVKGGSPDLFSDSSSYDDFYKNWQNIQDSLTDAYILRGYMDRLGISVADAKSEYRKEFEKEHHPEAGGLAKTLTKEQILEEVNRHGKRLDRARQAAKAGSSFEAYRKVAGEIEARDVQARLELTDEQRSATEPYSSENIALEDAIVIQESEGAASEVSPTPEGILITPPDQQYTFNEVFDVAYDMFGGEIPEGFTIVNDSKDKDFEFKAAYIPESGEIIVNLAYLNKNDDIRDTITHELGHYIYGDPEFRAAFDQFIASLSPEARADLDAYVDTAYNKETGEIRLEEKMVRAFVDQFINEEQAPAWRSMLDAIKRFLNKLGFKFNISDRDAISVFTAALDRYKAGEAISREGGARKIIDDLTAMDAEYLAAVEEAKKTGDFTKVQRMVDEAAKKAGYAIDSYHGTNGDLFTIFSTERGGDKTFAESARLGIFSTDNPDVAQTYAENIGAGGTFALGLGQGPLAEARDRAIATPEFKVLSQAKDAAEKAYSAASKRIYDQYLEIEKAQLQSARGAFRSMLQNKTEAEIDAFIEEVAARNAIREFSADEAVNKKPELITAQEKINEATKAINNYIYPFLLEALPNVRVMKLKLQIKNPKVYDAQGQTPADFSLSDKIQEAKDLGHDGVIFENIIDPQLPATHYVVFEPQQIKSADPVTYDDAGDAIPLSQRFRPTSPDIRRMAAEPRREQVAGMKIGRIITTPPGITQKTTDIIRSKFFDSTKVSPENTSQAWAYISQFMDETDNNNNKFAGYVNQVTEEELAPEFRKGIKESMGASLFSVELANYAGRLAVQGDTKMLAYMIRNGNKMPTGEFASGVSQSGRVLNAFKKRLSSDISGVAAYETELESNVERLAAVLFGTNTPSKEQIKIAQDALTESETIELGDANQVAADIKEVETRTNKDILKKIDDLISGYDNPKKDQLLLIFANLIRSRDVDGITISYKPTKVSISDRIANLLVKNLANYRDTLVDKAASGLESTFWRTMSSQENKPGLLGELDQAQNNELAKIVKATLIKMKLAGEPPNTKMTDIEKVASILNESKLSEEKRIEADKRIVAEIDRRRQEELSTTNNPDAVNAKYDSILKAWNDSMSRQLNMPVSDSMLQRLVSAEMKEQNIKIRDLVDEADGKVVAEKKQNIINSIIRKIYGVSKESETGIEMDENYDGLKSYLEQTLDNMYALSVEEKNAAYAKRQAQISLRNTAESQAQSIINRLADQLSDTPAFPQKQENEVKAIVQQDLKQIPDMNRKQPWISQLTAKLMRAGVSEAQAQTISDLVWRQHEIKAMDRESKELQTAAEKGSLAVIIDRIKNTSLERQQSPEWKQEVIKEYLRDAGLSSQAAETAAKLYDSVISERIAAAKQKAFEDTLSKAAPWKNYASRNGKLAKDALKKIKEAIRTGVLDPEKNTESIIAALSGWTGFTKEQYQRIVELDTILNDPNQDDITKREAMDALNKIITKAKMPVRFKDALGAYYIGNALMGIPTALVNIASPLGFSIRNLMVDIAKYAKENPAKIPVAFETFLDSMRSWYNQTAYAFKNQIYLNDVVEYLNGQNVLRETFDKGKKQWAEGKYAQGFANMAVGMTQITGRVLSALDQGAISMLENQNITRYAMSALENAKNKVPKNKVVEFANMTLDLKRRVMMESIAAGMDKDRAGVLADLAVKSELRAALSEYGADTQSVLDSAINDALQSVGRNKVISINGIKSEQQKLSDSGMLSYWPIKMLEKASEGVGSEGSGMQIFAKMVYGFALVPARTFHTAAWFSPYGFLRLAIDKYKKNKGYESPYAMSVQTDAQFRQRLTESIAGSIAMLGLFALRSGSSDEDEDKKFKIVITGNGPNATTDKQYYDSWIKKYKPYSIHIVVGDTVFPINIGRGGEALFFPIMLAGALDDYEIKKKQNLTKKEPSDLNVATEMLGSAFFALAQRGPYAAFTEPLFDASKQGRVTENLVSQLGYFGKTFVPVLGASITRNISDFINDPVDRSSIEGALYANTPIVGPWIGTKALNALGQPIRADDFSDKLFKLGVPVVFSFPKNTPENALNELILKQGSGPTLPTRANAQKRFGDVLTDKEFETYVREYGRVMSDKMFKNRTRLANMKAVDYDDELEKYARGYSIDGIKIKGASDSAVLAVKRMRQ